MAQCSPSVAEPLLDGENDSYGGFIVDPSRLPDEPSLFRERLQLSISRWTSEAKKGIWLKLPTEYAVLVPIAVKEGFVYHHAEQDYLMLTLWIPDSICTLPANASHQVGIGALVINSENRLLVVQEVTGPTRGSDTWKMPTGVVLQGEDIQEAAVREVKEETGVEAEFLEVFGVRQSHGVAFGKSDLFFLCLLRPVSSDIVIQKHEIEAAQWMPFDDYRSQESNTKSELLTRVANIIAAASEGKYTGFGAKKLRLSPRSKKEAYFHHNTRDIDIYLGDGKKSNEALGDGKKSNEALGDEKKSNEA
ncbi:hypothetical protein KP509_09G087200 [Ceratopteris richardii]|uniref:Nudix hydrolase domain-containing protein n=1 Tax=Ceratopteris richardii TaxID=49495 RepID=A0A8T2U4F5_CERRI|nr:hypothetical protein KP509_09G087200 [Ceratopteris richardii]KAH7430182.1 hypothetical protein KP509_09G087200 [Ceratopteris richardii]KAH7430183.1 hypothetical protein KP509_09G087200 [Ceratopteris richardii]KAH7430184.1 hypothetical protein KP509_09G087200 [Ceratopteris richardii]